MEKNINNLIQVLVIFHLLKNMDMYIEGCISKILHFGNITPYHFRPPNR